MSNRLVLTLYDADYEAYNNAPKPKRGFITGGVRKAFKAHAWVANKRVAIGTYESEYDARVAIHKVTTADDPHLLLSTRYESPRILQPRDNSPEEQDALNRAALMRRANIAMNKTSYGRLLEIVTQLETLDTE